MPFLNNNALPSNGVIFGVALGSAASVALLVWVYLYCQKIHKEKKEKLIHFLDETITFNEDITTKWRAYQEQIEKFSVSRDHFGTSTALMEESVLTVPRSRVTDTRRDVVLAVRERLVPRLGLFTDVSVPPLVTEFSAISFYDYPALRARLRSANDTNSLIQIEKSLVDRRNVLIEFGKQLTDAFLELQAAMAQLQTEQHERINLLAATLKK